MLHSHAACGERSVRAVVEGLEGRVLMCVDDAILSHRTALAPLVAALVGAATVNYVASYIRRYAVKASACRPAR